ncbi:MAG: hypothetical protein SF069_13410 [Phycisphaerae bacterium]|nr:hypothetical protein [Phycisphaerae bacterium]
MKLAITAVVILLAAVAMANLFHVKQISSVEPQPVPTAPASSQPASRPGTRSALGALPVWNDGLAEICYYDARRPIYGVERRYTSVHIVNREWFEPVAGVKTDRIDDPTAVAVLKLNVAEEVPTENYNYRLLTTLFVRRDDLSPLKLVGSSQEWCGSIFNIFRWQDDRLDGRTFSYFEGEAEQTFELAVAVRPLEAFLLIARDAVASGDAQPRERAAPYLAQLAPARRGPASRTPAPLGCQVRVEPAAHATVPAGRFMARRVLLTAGDDAGPLGEALIEVAPPHRVLRYALGGVIGELRDVERRAYWDGKWSSEHYERGRAP